MFGRLGGVEDAGALPVCHEGCGFFFLLIVTGPDRGKMWLDGRASDEGIKPVWNDEGKPVTFAAWYDNWLNACLAERDMHSRQVIEEVSRRTKRCR
jgi:hypothetical protein